MKVLLVDDTRTNQLIIGKYLRALGHEVVLADDGIQGVAAFQQEAPDLVLLDVMMPNMNGYEAAGKIRELSGDSDWTPIIFLSAKVTDDDIAAGIEAGGDDYLFKPVSKVVLGAKMQAMGRIAEMRNTIHEYAKAQALINEREAEEMSLALHVFDRMTRSDNLRHDWIKFVSRPSSHFSGDIIAAQVTPEGGMHVMLGDATGHGLAAGLTVMPVADLFYALTERGETISKIAQKLNSRLHDLLPTGRFVAAILVAIRPGRGELEVWNAGCPPVYCIDAQGEIKSIVNSSNLPLGIMPELLDVKSESFSYDPAVPEKLYFFSDGVPDAESVEDGRQFTLDRVEQVLAIEEGARLEILMEKLEAHVGEPTAQDDISIVEVSPPVLVESINQLQATG